MYKKVLMPIEVPDNDYCWDGKTPCAHLDTEGGHPTCDLKFNIGKYEPNGIKKPKECLNLVRVVGI